MRKSLDKRNGTDIHRIACYFLEGTNTTLTENDVAVALREDIFCGQEPSFNGGRHTALEHDRFVCPAYLIQKHIVLHIACAYLQNISVFADHWNVCRCHHLGNHRHAKL